MPFEQTLRYAAALLLLMAAMPAQTQQVLEVYPTGFYPDDVKQVHAALESLGDGVDGVIVLKSLDENGVETAFNFGTGKDPSKRGSVSPRPEWSGAIEIRGERRRNSRTVIEGGFNTITTDRRDRININNIEFRGPYQSAISIRETTGARVLDNVIVDAVGNMETTLVRPIRVQANVNGSSDEITGEVVVSRNRIDRATGWFSQGIAVVTANADVLVRNNEVNGVNVGIQLSAYQRGARLIFNTLNVAVPREGFFAAGVELNPADHKAASVNVSGNTISVVDTNQNGDAYGIVGTAYDGFGGDFHNSIIYGNSIYAKNIVAGIGLYVGGESRNVSDNIVARNVVSGSVSDGVILDVFQGVGRMLNNRIIANRLSGMNPATANSHIWLGEATRDTLCLAESSNIVVDHGVDNVIFLSD